LSVTETGAMSTRYRTVTDETYPKRRDTGAMMIELVLSSSVNSFEYMIEDQLHIDAWTVLNIPANGPSRKLADYFKYIDTAGTLPGNASRAGAAAARAFLRLFRHDPLLTVKSCCRTIAEL